VKFFRTVVSLCVGFRPYREIRDVPLSGAIKYLLGLMLLVALGLLATLVPWLVGRSEDFAAWVNGHFPPIAIQNGEVVTAVAQPYYSGDENFRLILDTSGTVTNADPTAVAGLLIMKDHFLMWVRNTNTPTATVQMKRQPLRGFPDGEVNGAYLRGLVRSFLAVALPLLYALLVLVGTLTCLLQAYLFSVIASFTERSLPAPLTMNQLLSVAIHAVTPAAIVFTVYTAFRLDGVNIWILYLIAYGIFLIGGTHACRDLPEKREEDDEPPV
jgi:hypothetical protein